AAPNWIVDDEAPSLAPGQMRKSAFLAQVRAQACTTADRALAQAGRSTRGCPYVEKWVAYYDGRDARDVERAVFKLAPGARAARRARARARAGRHGARAHGALVRALVRQRARAHRRRGRALVGGAGGARGHRR